MTRFIITNGRVLDEKGNTDARNILIENGMITGLGYLPDDDSETDDLREINAEGSLIIPNIIDSHVRLSDPRYERRETLEELNEAAIAGGVTAILGYPETPMDSPELIAHFYHRSRATMTVPLYPLGAITLEKKGKILAELGLMKRAGALSFTDGNSPESAEIMMHALVYSKMFDCRLIVRPSETTLSGDGIIHEGCVSNRLGLKGVPALAEVMRVTRDLQLLEAYGGKVHFFPITTKAALDVIIDAKARGLDVTCGTAPQYLYFTDTDCEGLDTHLKVWPPFRTDTDRDALIQGIRNGGIDIIASKHTPLTIDEKRQDFVSAKFGITGIELLIPTVLTILHHKHKLPLPTIFNCLSKNVYKAFNLKANGLSIGERPSFTIIDPNKEKVITESQLTSRCKNTPFIGKTLKGSIKACIIDGAISKA